LACSLTTRTISVGKRLYNYTYRGAFFRYRVRRSKGRHSSVVTQKETS